LPNELCGIMSDLSVTAVGDFVPAAPVVELICRHNSSCPPSFSSTNGTTLS
jgi:hypothetical protein